MSGNLSFYVKLAAGERVEATVTLPEDPRSAIVGTVNDSAGAPVPDALVLLFDEDRQQPLRQTYTDDGGMFFFGPLERDTLYYISIYRDTVRVRMLDITV